MGHFAFGSTLKLGSTTVSEVASISGPGTGADVVEVTHHGSTDRWREFVQGLRDGGEITVEGNLLTTSKTQVFDLLGTTSLVSCVITLPTTPSSCRWTANTIVTGFNTEAPVDGKLPFTAALKVSGKPDLSLV